MNYDELMGKLQKLKVSPRCKLCATPLKKGLCTNPKCIGYTSKPRAKTNKAK